ncbi:ATP-binding protein [Sanguibacter antarcticus]|uniref:ATP-binding protein n=1 Tax=Sanguibacter antarcticus TaxID=372484 RepID=UPI001B80DF3A|nr:ATP-binding protein [Sanguibacter antarcticus]
MQRWELDSVHALAGLRSSLHEVITGEAEMPAEDLTETPARIVLVASELATNALRHATAPRTVRLFARDHELLLDVVDHDPATPPVVSGGRPLGEGGFGLRLAQRLASQVGWYSRGTAKHVWASFPVTDHETVACGPRALDGMRLGPRSQAVA